MSKLELKISLLFAPIASLREFQEGELTQVHDLVLANGAGIDEDVYEESKKRRWRSARRGKRERRRW